MNTPNLNIQCNRQNLYTYDQPSERSAYSSQNFHNNSCDQSDFIQTVSYKVDQVCFKDNVCTKNDIYSYFSQKINRDQSDVVVIIDNTVVRRGLTFNQIYNCLETKEMQIYSIEKLLKQFQELQYKLDKQEKLMDFIASKYGIKLDYGLPLLISKQDENFVESKIILQKEAIKIPNLEISIYEENRSKVMGSLEKLINHKKMELLKLEKIHQQSKIFMAVNNNSVLRSMEGSCHFCNLPLTNSYVQTKCHHNFHYDCFESIAQTKIYENQPHLECICRTKLPLKCLMSFIGNYDKALNYNNQFLQIQLKLLKENNLNMFRSCATQGCAFFYRFKNVLNQKFYCPICDQ